MIRSLIVASLAVLASLGFARHLRGVEPASARERYDAFLSELRTARTLDFAASVVITRYRAGATTRSTGSLEASLGKGDRGRLRRVHDTKDHANTSTDSGSSAIEILADGEVAYQVDREARAYVKVWPPRFLAGGEGRSILPLRAFLDEAIEEPVAVAFQQHPKQAELSGFRLDYPGWYEVGYFDPDGALRIWVRTDDVDGMRTNVRFESYRADPDGDAASYARRPPSDHRDATSSLARSARTGFAPREAIATMGSASASSNAPSVLAPGAREVEASFLDASGALIRLAAMRGRCVVLIFLDRDAPQCVDAAKRVARLAAEFEANGSRAQFLVALADEPPPSRPDAPRNLRFVKSISPHVERAFGVFFHPTTFVIDRAGAVVLRGSVGFDEAAIREAIGE